MAYVGPQPHRGAVRQLVNGATNLHPVLQVIDVKLFGTAAGQAANTSERFRLIVSDGEHYQQAMLATQLNELIKTNQVQKGSVVQIDECVRPASRGVSLAPRRGSRAPASRAERLVPRAGISATWCRTASACLRGGKAASFGFACARARVRACAPPERSLSAQDRDHPAHAGAGLLC